MPNHYTTILICVGPERFDAEDWTDQHRETDFCRLVEPIPERLEEIQTGHNRGLKRWTGDMKQPVPVDEAELLRDYGARDWYEWALEHWGTKWGTYEARAHQLEGDAAPVVIEFQSAWGPPNDRVMAKIIEWLRKTCGFTSVACVGVDPACDEIEMRTGEPS